MLCMLNRKPYRDSEGNVRVRHKCCGKKSACTMSEQQPDGDIVKRGVEPRKKKFKVIKEAPVTKGKRK